MITNYENKFKEIFAPDIEIKSIISSLHIIYDNYIIMYMYTFLSIILVIDEMCSHRKHLKSCHFELKVNTTKFKL